MDSEAPDFDEHMNEPHEGEWIYFSAPLAHLNGSARVLIERIISSIRSRGWLVLGGEEIELTGSRHAARRIEALETADACLFDVSSASATVGAEVATAVFARRPIIALEHIASPPSEFIAALLERSNSLRVIRYEDVGECVEALCQTLEDPAWLAAVGHAVADVR